MYSELRLCIDVLAIVCVVLGLSLFAGTKRETLWDRNNLAGLLLLGVALLAHGGFDTILRSSPHATFSGYVLGWDRSSGDVASASGRIFLYDLGYPPAKDWVGAPNRAVYIPARGYVPSAVWSTDKIWLLRATYRTRDLCRENRGRTRSIGKSIGNADVDLAGERASCAPGIRGCDWPHIDARSSDRTSDHKGSDDASPLHIRRFAAHVHAACR
jgi:hypothetical protein